jgi:hypothetical protein
MLSRFQAGVGDKTLYPGGLSPDVLAVAQAMSDVEGAAKMITEAGRSSIAIPESLAERQREEEQELLSLVNSLPGP